MTESPSASRAPWMPYLTGLRGLAAFYVLLFHTLLLCHTYCLESPADGYFCFFSMGNIGVSAFIVLSGYCLMLPIVSDPDMSVRGGWWRFYSRRARRIIPAYYLMIGLSLWMCVHCPELDLERADSLTARCLWQHALFIQNWCNSAMSLDSPMWSIATEVQIYVLMPLIVWGWRRNARLVTILVLGGLSFIPHSLVPGVVSYFHYLLSFLLGCLAADIVHRPRDDAWSRLPWRDLTIMMWTVMLAVTTFAVDAVYYHNVLMDVIASVAMAVLLVHLGLTRIDNTRLVRILASPIPYSIGLLSYSLYLIHYPVLWIFFAHTTDIPWNGQWDNDFVFLCITAIPVVLVAAYVLYLVGERPFMSRGADVLPLPWPGVLKNAPRPFSLPPIHTTEAGDS